MDEKRKKKVKNLLFEVAFVYLGVLLFLYAFQRQIMYSPDVTRPMPAAFNAGDMSAIDVKTADNLTLSGWYKAPADATKPIILMFHGNHGNIGSRNFKARIFINQGYGVLMAEYRGYGGNPGTPTEQGLYADARAYVSWLMKQGFNPSRIVLCGESLGTGVATQMAFETPGYRALVLESPFTSAAQVAQKHYFYVPALLLVKDRYNSLAKIRDIKTSLLIIHGDIDNTVPYSEGKELFDTANEPKKMETLAGAGHNDLYRYGAGTKILAFLEGLKPN